MGPSNLSTGMFRVDPLVLCDDIDSMIHLNYQVYRSCCLKNHVSERKFRQQDKQRTVDNYSERSQGKQHGVVDEYPARNVMLKVVLDSEGPGPKAEKVERGSKARKMMGKVVRKSKAQEKMVAYIVIRAPDPYTSPDYEIGGDWPGIQVVDPYELGRILSPIREVSSNEMGRAVSAPQEDSDATEGVLAALQMVDSDETGGALSTSQEIDAGERGGVFSDVKEVDSDKTGSASSTIQEEDSDKTGNTWTTIQEDDFDGKGSTSPSIQEDDFNRKGNTSPSIQEDDSDTSDDSILDATETYSQRDIRKKREAFGDKCESRLWEVVALVVDKKHKGIGAELQELLVRWGVEEAKEKDLTAEGVCVVTSQRKKIYEAAGFQLMKKGKLHPSRWKHYWFIKRFGQGSG